MELSMSNIRNDRRIKYTKMVLKESFINLLKEKPLSKITIKEICENADINRATFYAHYRDQYDLLHQIEQELIDGINQYLGDYAFSDTVDISVEALEQIFTYIKQNAKICTILLGDSGDDHFRQQVMRIVRDQCVAAWTINKALAPEDAEYIYAFAIEGSVGLIQKWLADGGTKSARAMAELILQITNYGLSGFEKEM